MWYKAVIKQDVPSVTRTPSLRAGFPAYVSKGPRQLCIDSVKGKLVKRDGKWIQVGGREIEYVRVYVPDLSAGYWIRKSEVAEIVEHTGEPVEDSTKIERLWLSAFDYLSR